ncbi:MerC family mercury resistance protein [Granulicella arctica]|uniref:MerC family mercury resistance protein n=1 Tax=Granulicella arctica TaxID=940613 RepID=UPI0015C9E4A1
MRSTQSKDLRLLLLLPLPVLPYPPQKLLPNQSTPSRSKTKHSYPSINNNELLLSKELAHTILTRPQDKKEHTITRLHQHADIAGATASAICLVHCLLTPVAISLFPNILPYLPGDTATHRLLAIGVVLFGLIGFLPGYRIHRRKPLLALIAAGIALILIVAWTGNSLNRTAELLLSVTGSFLLVTAHLLNRSFCHQCRTCTTTCATTHIG